jgi:hypothetical protein
MAVSQPIRFFSFPSLPTSVFIRTTIMKVRAPVAKIFARSRDGLPHLTYLTRFT